MYRIEDTVSAIKEVQRLLDLNQTGIYDNATREAVVHLQTANGLTAKEIIDYETFVIIVNEYKKKKRERTDTDYLHIPSFPYTVESHDENVGKINDALRLVLREYVYDGIEPRGKYFGINTLNATNYLRSIFRMDSSDSIDEAFMNRLLFEKKAIEIKSKYG